MVPGFCLMLDIGYPKRGDDMTSFYIRYFRRDGFEVNVFNRDKAAHDARCAHMLATGWTEVFPE